MSDEDNVVPLFESYDTILCCANCEGEDYKVAVDITGDNCKIVGIICSTCEGYTPYEENPVWDPSPDWPA